MESQPWETTFPSDLTLLQQLVRSFDEFPKLAKKFGMINFTVFKDHHYKFLFIIIIKESKFEDISKGQLFLNNTPPHTHSLYLSFF